MTGWSLLKWTTIGMNILLILWMFATAYAWGGGNWMGQHCQYSARTRHHRVIAEVRKVENGRLCFVRSELPPK